MDQARHTRVFLVDDHEALFDAIMAGANGLTLKEALASEVVTSMRTIGSGGSLLDPQTTTALLRWLHRQQEQSDAMHRLTERERMVLVLIGEGLTNREIAERLDVGERAVKGDVSQLLAKLDMQRRTQAAAFAARLRQDDVGGGRPAPAVPYSGRRSGTDHL